MEHTDNCKYTRYFLMQNIKVTRMHSNIYTHMIFIGMRVRITIYTGNHPETLIIVMKSITQTSVIFLVSPRIIRANFFPRKDALQKKK